MFVIGKNLETIPKDKYFEEVIKEYDIIEIVEFFRGG